MNFEIGSRHHLYFPTIDQDTPFFFGFNKDANGKPIIGSGAYDDRTYIFPTTLKLLRMNCDTSNQNHSALFHVDATYKLSISRHPLLLFGRSNFKKEIKPIVLGIISQEETLEFKIFFSSIHSLCQHFGINFVLRYMMQDAQASSSAAVRAVFGPDVTVLMCYFHLNQNVKKHLDKSVKHLKDIVLGDISCLHYCTDLTQYLNKRHEIISKWETFLELKQFKTYFVSQWIESQWLNWQLFSRPPGFSTTNNNVESINGQIKKFFAKYRRGSINECL
ncbi:unnamed protein product [Brachionus calyciflorus]|uniref:MULE transposase domain-containing protein n=1 Tax=Brachionus calyciflorus TaxID=104777 RepID=A0A814IUZ4_9BILA|nr:unnamed protein product [Brachionus calyciflorus]